MNGLTEICHCGHAKETHYWDMDGKSKDSGDCLGVHCECKKYINSREPTAAQVVATLKKVEKMFW